MWGSSAMGQITYIYMYYNICRVDHLYLYLDHIGDGGSWLGCLSQILVWQLLVAEVCLVCQASSSCHFWGFSLQEPEELLQRRGAEQRV